MSERAKIFEIKRFAVHDGDGIRTTVFFKGCPLRCVWCHNPEGISAKSELGFYLHKCTLCGECARVCPEGVHKFEDGRHTLDRAKCTACGKCAEACFAGALTLYGKDMTVDELLPILLEDADFYKSSKGGVTLSGGECLLWADFCAELLKKLCENGIHTAVDTCGDVPREALDKVIPYTDVFLYDVKAFDSSLHEAVAGRPNGRIIENLRYLDSVGAPCEIRIPYVPGVNGGELEGIAAFLEGLSNVTRVRVLPYHSYAGSKYLALGYQNTMPERMPTEEELLAAEGYFKNINSRAKK